jgi:plastocyanin
VRAARRAAFGAVLALVALLLLAPGQASAATYRVAMQGYAFAPATLTVPVGSTVTWTNGDTAPHDVKTTSGPVAIHSPMLSKGQSWTYTFTTAGSYSYYCTVHPDMTARITVLAAPKPTPTRTPTPTHHHETGSSHEAMPMPTRTAPTSHRPAATSPESSAPAASSPSPSTSPPGAAAAPRTEPVAAARPLQPLLLLTGLVAGVAVLCLLLVGSRASVARDED